MYVSRPTQGTSGTREPNFAKPKTATLCATGLVPGAGSTQSPTSPRPIVRSCLETSDSLRQLNPLLHIFDNLLNTNIREF
jgi:hypothetical protein